MPPINCRKQPNVIAIATIIESIGNAPTNAVYTSNCYSMFICVSMCGPSVKNTKEDILS